MGVSILRRTLVHALPAAVALAPGILATGRTLPSDRVRIGLIGCGGRGRELLNVLANITYRMGRKLRWDGERETIVGDQEFAQLLKRARRKGYELPAG